MIDMKKMISIKKNILEADRKNKKMINNIIYKIIKKLWDNRKLKMHDKGYYKEKTNKMKIKFDIFINFFSFENFKKLYKFYLY